MILIWRRWGILVLACVGVGMALSFGLLAAVDPGDTGPVGSYFAGIGLIIGAGLCALLGFCWLPKLDRPTPIVQWVPLPQPIQRPNGVQTHQPVQVVDPRTGQPLFRHPQSTFFFLPVRYWTFVLGGLGVLIAGASLVGSLLA